MQLTVKFNYRLMKNQISERNRYRVGNYGRIDRGYKISHLMRNECLLEEQV